MPPFLGDSSIHHDDGNEFTGFTSGLLNSIVVSKSKMDDWVEYQKAKIDEREASFQLKLEQEQKSIDSLVTNLLGVQLERGLSLRQSEEEESSSQEDENLSHKKKALQEQQTKLDHDLAKLQSELKNREKRVQEISMEESKQKLRAQEARSLKQRVQEAKQTTVDDLTKGIVNYKHLGLDFQKTNIENELRFFFSLLDPADPLKKCSFVLQVDDLDSYDVCDCEPSIDAALLMQITNRLNQTDDMGYLVRTMRRAFLETL